MAIIHCVHNTSKNNEDKNSMLKKLYVSPNIKIIRVESQKVLTASRGNNGIFYGCPHMPETWCNWYNNKSQNNQSVGFDDITSFGFSNGLSVPQWDKIFIQGDKDCPYKNYCKHYNRYKQLVNERNR